MSRRRTPRATECPKRKWGTRGEAELALEAARAQRGHGTWYVTVDDAGMGLKVQAKVECRTYPCALCGCWHLTSQESRAHA